MRHVVVVRVQSLYAGRLQRLRKLMPSVRSGSCSHETTRAGGNPRWSACRMLTSGFMAFSFARIDPDHELACGPVDAGHEAAVPVRRRERGVGERIDDRLVRDARTAVVARPDAERRGEIGARALAADGDALAVHPLRPRLDHPMQHVLTVIESGRERVLRCEPIRDAYYDATGARRESALHVIREVHPGVYETAAVDEEISRSARSQIGARIHAHGIAPPRPSTVRSHVRIVWSPGPQANPSALRCRRCACGFSISFAGGGINRSLISAPAMVVNARILNGKGFGTKVLSQAEALGSPEATVPG